MGSVETTIADCLDALRSALVEAKRQKGRLAVWVTHMFVLADLVGANTASGEGLVLQADAAGKPVVLGRLGVA